MFISVFKKNLTFVFLLFGIITSISIALLRDKNVDRDFYTIDTTNQFYLKKTNQQENDISILGECRVLTGLSPSSIKSVLGDENLKITNLAFLYQNYSEDYLNFALHSLKQKGKRIILLGVQPSNFLRYKSNVRNFTYYKTYPYSNKFEELYLTSLTKFFKPFNFKQFHKSSIKKTFKVFHQDGYMEQISEIKGNRNATQEYINALKNYPYDLKYINNLVEFVKKAGQKNIKVLYFYIPTGKEITKFEQSFPQWDYQKVSQSLSEAGAKEILAKLNKKLIFHDGDHMESNSSKKYSIAIANEIKSSLLR